MKNLILILALLPTMAYAQYPIVEDFTSATGWTFNNGAGIMIYSSTDTVASTNLGNTPYPNSSTIDILSPVWDLSDCGVDLEVSFGLSGNIENNWDFMYFEYYNGSGWVSVDDFTGYLPPGNIESYFIPATATQFRFRTITDVSVNTSGGFVYYYDIDNFTIDCALDLPVELTKFDGECGLLKWETESELNNDYFLVEESVDMVNWKTTGIVNGSGTTNEAKSYELNVTARGLMYYRLTQVDFNGDREVFKSISVNCDAQEAQIVGYYNLLGQKVTPNEKGIILVLYSDGNTTKVFNK